jgi:tetratricopeptide (TPR) repeat protein
MVDSDQAIADKKPKALEFMQQERLAEARAVWLDLINLRPADADAWCRLSTVEGRMGNIDGAERAVGRALEIDSNLAEGWLGMGHVLESRGRRDDALKTYLHAVSLKPHLAEAHAGLGRIYRATSRLQLAADHFRRAVELGLKPPKLMIDYADVLRGMARFKEAMAIYQELAAASPGDAELLYRMGSIYIDLSELDQAQRIFGAAIEADPEHVGARVGEITVLRMQQKFDEALAKIEPLFEAKRDSLPITLTYAGLCHINHDCARVIERLEQLQASGTSSNWTVQAAFWLGRLYDAQSDYDKAFGWYQRANEMLRGNYDAVAADAFVDAIITGYSKEKLAHAARAEPGDMRPVFIIGMPRSGSSLVEQILASHPEVSGAGEMTDMADLLLEARHGRSGVEALLHDIDNFDVALLNRLAARYSARLDAVSHGERYVTDKLPSNFFRLGFVSLLFPKAKIIHCRRDPLDTCLSCYFQSFSGFHPYSNDFESLGNYYKNYRSLMAHWREVIPLPMLEIDYEKLVGDQEGETRRLLGFLGLDWDDRCLQFYRSERVTVTASSAQVQEPIYTGSVGRWKHYEKYLAPLKAALA